MKKKKISLALNKEVIDQLDKTQLMQINGGDFTTIFGSNCYNTNPTQYNCCAGNATDPGACVSYTTNTGTSPGVCATC